MLKKIAPLVFINLFTLSALAQKSSTIDKFASVTLALGGNQFTTAIAYQHLWKLGKKQKWEIGTGGRFTSIFGNNVYYKTAPAKLTSGKTGPGVLFADDILQNIDSVKFNKTQFNALNISVNFAYNINNKFTAGFNIDAIGFSFGGKQNGTYYPNSGITTATSAKPTSFNLLLVSDNDLGTLNSELYGAYKINNKWGAKLGFQFLFTEYTTATAIQTTPDGKKNDRFRNKMSGISIGTTYKF